MNEPIEGVMINGHLILTDEQIDAAVAESIAAQPNGCCGGPDWRGHLCEWHSGFEAGLDAARPIVERANKP